MTQGSIGTTVAYPAYAGRWPLGQFVTAPTHDAAVLLDFNAPDDDGVDSLIRAADFTIGAPELLGSPDGVDVEYGPRTIVVSLRITGTRQAALRRQSAIARELLRGASRRWFRFQLDVDTDPIWFRVYRPRPGELDFTLIDVTRRDTPDMWRLSMTLLAEPYAYGARVTQPMVRVSSDPSDPDGCRTVLDPIVGDAPTPLRVEVRALRGTPLTAAATQRWLVGVQAPSSRPGAVREPILLPVTTSLDDEAVLEAHDRYVGGQAVAWSKNAASPIDLRASTGPVRLPLGTYRVYARVHRFGSATGTIGVAFGAGDLTTPKTLWRTGSGASEACVWVDLGPRTVGAGGLPADVVDDAPEVDTQVVLTSAIAAPGGKLACDAVWLVPVPDAGDPVGDDAAWSALALTYQATSLPEGDVWVWDGAEETSWARANDDRQIGDLGVTHEGMAPLGVPGPDGDGNNTLMLLAHTTVDETGFVSGYRDRLDMTCELVVSYHPLRLWLGDGESRP